MTTEKPSVETRKDTLVGQIVADRYLIHHRVGEGGMGVVYRAEHIGLKKDVAVKILLPELGAIEGVVKRFEREARSMSRLDHPGVVRVTDFGSTKDHLLFLVMDFIDGEPLGDLIARTGRLEPGRAVHLVRQVLLALDHAHSLGVVHRDLKPDNIMVMNPDSASENTKILDFGIAKILEDSSEDKKPLTVAGTVFGTPEYLSPEQAAGDPADIRADLYTVGVILYELVTGERPFKAKNRMELIKKHISADPKPITNVLPISEIPEDLDTVILKAMAKDPDDRYQTAMELYNDLSALPMEHRAVTFWPSQSQPTGVNPLEITAVGKKPAASKKKFHIAATIAVLLIVAAAALFFVFRSDKKDSPVDQIAAKEEAMDKNLLAGLDEQARKQVRTARAHINAVKPEQAVKILEPLLKEHEEIGYIHYLVGRAQIMLKNISTGLNRYARAVELEPVLRKDKRLQEDVFLLLTSKIRKHRKAAVEFIEDSLAEDSLDILVRSFEELNNYQILRATLLIAEKHGFGDKVKKNRFYELMLRDSPHCAERGEAAKQLMLSEDVEALPALRAALVRKPWRSYGRKRSNDCIKDTLEEAIKRLETIEEQKSGQKKTFIRQREPE